MITNSLRSSALYALLVSFTVVATAGDGTSRAALGGGALTSPQVRKANAHPLPPGTQEPPFPETVAPIPMSRKQERDVLKMNFEKMKKEADELAALAKSLQEDLNRSNSNVLSLKVVDRAERIEKLARKIRNMAKLF